MQRQKKSLALSVSEQHVEQIPYRRSGCHPQQTAYDILNATPDVLSYGDLAILYSWADAGGAIPGMKDYAPEEKRRMEK